MIPTPGKRAGLRAPSAIHATLCGLLLGACGAQNKLAPAPGATLAEGLDDTVIATDAQAQLTAQVDSWDGEARITDEVTPIRVTIEHRGNQPLAIWYRNFTLTVNGTEYHALPPFEIRGQVPLHGYGPVGYANDGYAVWPLYDSLYPNMGPYDGPFDYDPGYYTQYYGDWQAELPTPDMIEQALPEGVLSPGGQIEGYIYFPKIERDEGRATMRVVLTDPATNDAQATLVLPFVVD